MNKDNELQFIALSDYPYKVLPSGIHHLTENEFSDLFVKPFPGSITRALISEKYSNFRQIIKNLVSSFQWVDGSFVENKENPNDVDVVFFISFNDWINLTDAQDIYLNSLFEGNFAVQKFKTDAYLVCQYPNEHPLYYIYQKSKYYWKKWFGETRKKQAKGFVELQVNLNRNAN